MRARKKSHTSLIHITASFLVLYVVVVAFVFFLDLGSGIVLFALVSAVFLLSFFFQYYLLKQEILGEEKSKERMRRLLAEQDRAAKMLIRRDRDLTRSNEHLEEIGRMKSEFVSVAAHQIRTPLSGLKWSLDMLISGELGELTVDQKGILMKSYENNERMISLINNLLNADRIESGRTEIKFIPISIKDVIDSVLYYVLPQSHERDISVRVEVEDDLPTVRADSHKIRQVFQNLLENAVKYTKKGGEVVVTITVDGDHVLVAVRDNGIGIPKEEQDKIFRKFFRSNNAVQIKAEGTGLGLFVAKEIVERHGGAIWFESVENEGTTFFVKLPVLSAEDALKNAAEENHLEKEGRVETNGHSDKK